MTFEIKKTIRLILEYLQRYSAELFMIVVFAYISLYIAYYGGFVTCGITPDSASYFSAALSLQNGDGLDIGIKAGYSQWLSAWPAGYPILLAITNMILGHSMYLGSLILNIFLIGLGLIFFYLKFKKDAWIFSLVYLNVGFYYICTTALSENPFILSMIIWGVL